MGIRGTLLCSTALATAAVAATAARAADGVKLSIGGYYHAAAGAIVGEDFSASTGVPPAGTLPRTGRADTRGLRSTGASNPVRCSGRRILRSALQRIPAPEIVKRLDLGATHTEQAYTVI